MRSRAGGRRSYNRWRQHLANDRRRRLVEEFGLIFLLPKRGQVKEAAEALGVDRVTIWRDFRVLREEWRDYMSTPAGWRRVMNVRASQER